MDAVILNCVTQFNIVWRVGTFPFLPMSKCCWKTRCVTVAESLFKKKAFPQQTLDALLTNAAWWLNSSNRCTQRCVFHRATYKDVGMALNLNHLIVSAPHCIYIFTCSIHEPFLWIWFSYKFLIGVNKNYIFMIDTSVDFFPPLQNFTKICGEFRCNAGSQTHVTLLYELT
jgi:hypothetical protein